MTRRSTNTFYDGLGGGGWGWRGWGGWGGRWGTTQTTVTNVPVGTLMLDMYDASTHQLIWRGRTTDSLSNNGDKNTKKLDKDIDKMLNGFPPRTKGLRQAETESAARDAIAGGTFCWLATGL